MNKLSILIKIVSFTILVAILGCSDVDITQVKKEIVEKRGQLTAQQQISVNIELKELETKSTDMLAGYIDMYNRSIVEIIPEFYSLEKDKESYAKNFKLEDENYVEETYKLERSDNEILSEYLNYIQSGLSFYQQYSNELLDLRVIHYYGLNSRGVPAYIPEPIPMLGSDQFIMLTKLYHNGIEEEVNRSSAELNREVFNIDKTVLIDSITVSYSIPFISELDSVIITPSDVGKTVKGFQILELTDNYIYYIEPEKRILETMAYSASGKPLISLYDDRGFDYYLKDSLANSDNLETIISSLDKAKSDSSARCLVENYLVTRKLNYRNYTPKISFCEGNIAKYLIVFEKERAFEKFDVTFSNLSSNQQIFIKQLSSETEFVDSKGATLFKSPLLDLKYVGTEGGVRCANYIKHENREVSPYKYTYYYVDVVNKKLVELEEAKAFKVMNDNLVAMEISGDSESTKEEFGDRLIPESYGKDIILFNSKNERVSDDIYSYVGKNNGVIVAYRGDDNTILNASGQRVGEQGLRSIDNFHYGLASVSGRRPTDSDYSKGTYFKVGFVNTKGEYVVPLQYDSYEELPHCDYSSGFLMVGKDGLLGVVDMKDSAKLVIPCIYKEMYLTDDTNKLLYTVNVAGEYERYGVIDEKGETIIPFNYSEYDILEELKKRGLYREE